jgi:hypothetical protein
LICVRPLLSMSSNRSSRPRRERRNNCHFAWFLVRWWEE